MPKDAGVQVRRRRTAGRVIRHVVKVTEAEESMLVARAGERGVTVARLLADAALGTVPAPPRVSPSELFAIRRQLTGLAGNVNQLARSANSGVFVDLPEVLVPLEAIADVTARLDVVLDGAR